MESHYVIWSFVSLVSTIISHSPLRVDLIILTLKVRHRLLRTLTISGLPPIRSLPHHLRMTLVGSVTVTEV